MCWGTAQNTALMKLQKLQNKVIRYMTNTPLSSDISQKFKELNILNINELFFLESCKFMHKVYNKKMPGSFDEYFMDIDHNHDTRNRHRLQYQLPNPKLNLGKKSVKYFGIKIWSKLDQQTKNVENKKPFSDKVKQLIIDKQLDICY